ncbi:MAG: hypothetical protein RBT37_07980 [Dissulfurispiraceae bacterium]|jgi:sulfur relay (sulfurtransferase) complex TusBCD TusD component (DsrE family)|nr:hypothetical protein [Dissulfurispiraceae bacterium]
MSLEKQKVLMERVKIKTEAAKETIDSLVYFVKDSVIYISKDLATSALTLMMSWLEGEMLKSKKLYEPEGNVAITKVLNKKEKEAMLFMMSDGAIIVVSTNNPTGTNAQIIKQK